MLFKLSASIAPALILALALATPVTAQTVETGRFAVPASVSIPTDNTQVVVTGVPTPPSPFFASSCMTNAGFSGEIPGVRVVVVDPSTPPAATILDLLTLLPTGTRLHNLVALGVCFEFGTLYQVYEGELLSPSSQSRAFIATPSGVTLAQGHEAIIKGKSDALGFSKVICIQPGSPATNTDIWCDIPLGPGSRITDFTPIATDPVTGISYYEATVEN